MFRTLQMQKRGHMLKTLLNRIEQIKKVVAWGSALQLLDRKLMIVRHFLYG